MDGGCVLVYHRKAQRCLAVLIGQVRVHSFRVEQECHDIRILVPDGPHESCVAVEVSLVHEHRSLSQQETHKLDTPPLGRI